VYYGFHGRRGAEPEAIKEVTKMSNQTNTDKMIAAHEAEAKRINAKIWNHGWVGGENVWLSKTSHGLLETKISKTGKITHKWEIDFNIMSTEAKKDWMVGMLVAAVIEQSARKVKKMIRQLEQCDLSVAHVEQCKTKAEEILNALEAAA